MGIFISKKFASSKQMLVPKAKYSPVMKKLMQNKKISRVLDKKAERMELYNDLREKRGGGVTMDELREVMGNLRSGRGKFIDKKEARALANELVPKYYGSRKYIFKKPAPPTATAQPNLAPSASAQVTRSSLIRAFGRKNVPQDNPTGNLKANKFNRFGQPASTETLHNKNAGVPPASNTSVKSKMF